MFRNIIFFIVFLSPPFLKIHILRCFCHAKIGQGVYVGWFSSVMGKSITISNYSEIRSLTLIKCDQNINIGEYSAISNFVFIYGAGSFMLGSQSYVGPQCLFNVDDDLRIGDISTFGPRTMIFTHSSFLPYTEGYWAKLASVVIGNHVWIAAGVFIHPGVNIGNNIFINANSVVKNDISDNQIIEGFPARTVGDMDKMKRVMTPSRLDAVSWQMVKSFSEIILRKKMGVYHDSETAGRIFFNYCRKKYGIICITSDETALPVDFSLRNKRVIFIVSRNGWIPPLGSFKKLLVIDLAAKSIGYSRDKIYLELYLFIKRFYGVQLKYVKK